jgi:hypothetical protein
MLNYTNRNCEIWGFHTVVSLVGRCEDAKHPGRPVTWKQALILAVARDMCTFCIVMAVCEKKFEMLWTK